MTGIASRACKDLKQLASLTIGKNIAQIGTEAFYGCEKLQKITIQTVKLTDSSVGVNAFLRIYEKPTVKCPAGKLEAYQAMLPGKGMPRETKYQ